jgi:drug/metabolite transporter (DMT)-like permease
MGAQSAAGRRICYGTRRLLWAKRRRTWSGAVTTRAVQSSRATSIGVIAILLWAALALLTVRAGLIPPFELLSLCFSIAFLAGIAVLASRGSAALAQLRQPFKPWFTAFFAIFLYHALYFYALSTAPPARASLIAYLWPLLIVLMSAMSATGSERLRPRHLIGALLGLAGTCLVVLGQRGSGPATGSVLGYAAAACCALVWSSYSVVNRRFAKTPSAMIVGVCGAVALAGAACHVMFETATVWPDASQWAAIVGLGVGPTGLAFLAWDFATKHGNLPLLGALSYLAPVVSTLLLTVAGAVPASTSLFLSAFLVIAGALVATGIRLAPFSSDVSNE